MGNLDCSLRLSIPGDRTTFPVRAPPLPRAYRFAKSYIGVLDRDEYDGYSLDVRYALITSTSEPFDRHEYRHHTEGHCAGFSSLNAHYPTRTCLITLLNLVHPCR